MPTKKFAWKDRDSAALDLIQLVYHAPEPVSLQALRILSAIRSPAIVLDLKAIVLDSDSATWDRIYGLRALGNTSSKIYFPELSTILDNDLTTRQRIIASHPDVLRGIKDPNVYIPLDMVDDIIFFADEQESNRSWLFEHLDQADPQVIRLVLSNLLYVQMPEEFKALLMHLHPDIEQKYQRDQALEAAQLARREGKPRNRIRAESKYKATAIWRELEALYERAHNGDERATRELYNKSYLEGLSIPSRALATHFLAKLRDHHAVFGELAYLARWPCDMWEQDFSPVRSEAGQALFEIGTAEAWETLISACFANPSPTLNTLLSHWIELLTDKLSGVERKRILPPHGIESYQYAWFHALLREKAP